MTYGLTDQGLIIPSFGELADEIENGIRREIGLSLVSPSSAYAKLRDIMANGIHLAWLGIDAVWQSGDPNGAKGAALKALCAFTGTIQRGPSASYVLVHLGGNIAATIPDQSLIATASTDAQFRVPETTLTLLANWANTTAYALADVITANGSIWRCIEAGVSAAIGTGPSGDSQDITDGTCRWQFLGVGTYYATATATAVNTGPVVASALDMRVIRNPVVGWLSVLNLNDASLGRIVDSDETLRLRRQADLVAASSTPVEALARDLADVRSNPGVESVTVFHNPTNFTNVDGMPPNSVEAMLLGGEEATIKALIWKNVAGGIRTHGNVTTSIVDSQGFTQPILYSRPVSRDIYVTISLIIDSTFPLDGEDQVISAIIANGNAQKGGKNAVAMAIVKWAMSVQGVLDVPIRNIGLTPSPSSPTTVPISARQMAVYAAPRIVISAITVEEP